MSSTHDHEIYISVDIEAAGPIPGHYSMLSLGACIVDSPDITFYVELQPITERAVDEALSISRLNLEQLVRTGHPPREAMIMFRDWVQEVASERRPVFVGFNASFDWAFVNWYFHTFIEENPFGIGALDIKAYYMGLSGCAWKETTSSRLPAQFRSSLTHTHNALDDARVQAEIFAKMLGFRQT